MNDLFLRFTKELLKNKQNSPLEMLPTIAEQSEKLFIAALRMLWRKQQLSSLELMQSENIWKKMGSPDLKPNPTSLNLYFLSDATTEPYNRFLTPLAATYGLKLNIGNSAFDSIEQEIYNHDSYLYNENHDTILFMPSSDWLTKNIGSNSVIDQQQIDDFCSLLDNLLLHLLNNTVANIMVVPFLPERYPAPSGFVNTNNGIGRNLALQQINLFITKIAPDRICILDSLSPILNAGGIDAFGGVSSIRARIVHETEGMVEFCKEVVMTLAGMYGKSTRALVLDWDNTIWGGIVAENEAQELLCSVDNPAEMGYYLFQQYVKSLQDIGVVLAGVSRNLPEVAKIFDIRSDMPLTRSDFTSLQISHNPKSQSITQVSEDLNFGTEYMIFVDDSIFELIEVAITHPYIDIMLAGPSGLDTLQRISYARPGHTPVLLGEDQNRAVRLKSIVKQKQEQAAHGNANEFLKSIDIKLKFAIINNTNEQRVAQLFMKTNQFNLTTRRYSLSELQKMSANGGTIAAVEYEDKFGSQGIISAVVLVPESNNVLRIDSWLMSCRVLNRTVEEAVFAWIIEQAKGRKIIGEYIPTAKNQLVAGLFKRFGFKLSPKESTSDGETWSYSPQKNISIDNFCEIEV